MLEGSINGIRVRFIDTPGLVPAASAVGHNAKILAQIKKAHKKYKPDNVLYFDRMDMVRVRPDILRLCQCGLASCASSPWYFKSLYASMKGPCWCEARCWAAPGAGLAHPRMQSHVSGQDVRLAA